MLGLELRSGGAGGPPCGLGPPTRGLAGSLGSGNESPARRADPPDLPETGCDKAESHGGRKMTRKTSSYITRKRATCLCSSTLGLPWRASGLLQQSEVRLPHGVRLLWYGTPWCGCYEGHKWREKKGRGMMRCKGSVECFQLSVSKWSVVEEGSSCHVHFAGC